MTRGPVSRLAVALLGMIGLQQVAGQGPAAAPFDSGLVFSSVVRLVQVHATVEMANRRYVPGLTADNFQIFDNGTRQEVSAFEADDSGFSCALLIDTTGSMKGALPTLKRALLQFIDSLRAVDAVAVYAFSTQLERLQPLRATGAR